MLKEKTIQAQDCNRFKFKSAFKPKLKTKTRGSQLKTKHNTIIKTETKV